MAAAAAPISAPTASVSMTGAAPSRMVFRKTGKFSMPAMARASIWASGTPACRKCSGVSEPECAVSTPMRQPGPCKVWMSGIWTRLDMSTGTETALATAF